MTRIACSAAKDIWVTNNNFVFLVPHPLDLQSGGQQWQGPVSKQAKEQTTGEGASSAAP